LPHIQIELKVIHQGFRVYKQRPLPDWKTHLSTRTLNKNLPIEKNENVFKARFFGSNLKLCMLERLKMCERAVRGSEVGFRVI
jgi:hypothetical protein